LTRARGPRYRVPFRRRREKKTDYYSRRKAVLSGKPRLVIRPSSKHIIAQVIEAYPKSDITLVSSHSCELESFGWKGGTGNLSAAYLTGLLLSLRARSAGIEEAILDAGVKKPVACSRIYAALKGVLDGGLHVPHGEDLFPGEDRIRGEHIAEYGALLRRSDEDAYKERFSRLLSEDVKPEMVPELFGSTKSRIIESLSDEIAVQ